jgi:CTP synthase
VAVCVTKKNVDAGLQAPNLHGECRVLWDGEEVDLDYGHYERALGVRLTSAHNLTMGKINRAVIEKERRGEYLGSTVQLVPHVTDAIETCLENLARIHVDPKRPGINPDVLIIELGGTVGDIESIVPLEALRRMRRRVGSERFFHAHLVLVPGLGPLKELKTKLAQHAVAELRKAGHTPDLLMCRSPSPLTPAIKNKLAEFCSVAAESVVSLHDLLSLYRLPSLMAKQGVDRAIMRQFHLDILESKSDDVVVIPTPLERWDLLAAQDELPDSQVRLVKIALVGKYVDGTDAYLSVVKALEHAGATEGVRVTISWIHAGHLEKPATITANDAPCPKHTQAWADLRAAHAVLVPGGFGVRGTEGLILVGGTLEGEHSAIASFPPFTPHLFAPR